MAKTIAVSERVVRRFSSEKQLLFFFDANRLFGAGSWTRKFCDAGGFPHANVYHVIVRKATFSSLDDALIRSARLRFEMMAGDEFEGDEAEAGAESEGGVEELLELTSAG